MSKLPNVGTSIFSVMSKLATEHNAINLSQGFPNFRVDEKLTEIIKTIASENVHQYTPAQGHPPLINELCQLIQSNYNRTLSPSTELLITAGATQGIYTALQALIQPLDEVCILDPCYDSYDPSIVMAGGKPIHISLKDDYTPDWEKINASISNNTAMLIINNPHNPSGKTWTEQDMLQLEDLCDRHPQLMILSDEVYEFIHFENKHISINTRAKLIDRSIIISSFGKTFHITGWKVGYLVAPERLMKEILKVHQYLVFSVNSLAQHALSLYLKQTQVEDLGPFYMQKRDLFRSLMKNSRFQLLPCEGSYFQVASYDGISNLSDVEFTKELTIKHKVAAIPMSVFNASGKDLKHIRFCFAKTEETLIQATQLLCKI